MPKPDAKLIFIHPHPFDDNPLHRISQELRRMLADTLIEPLPDAMLVQLRRLERKAAANRSALP